MTEYLFKNKIPAFNESVFISSTSSVLGSVLLGIWNLLIG